MLQGSDERQTDGVALRDNDRRVGGGAVEQTGPVQVVAMGYQVAPPQAQLLHSRPVRPVRTEVVADDASAAP